MKYPILILTTVIASLGISAANVARHEIRVATYHTARCTTDTDCMIRFGGDGGPAPMIEETQE